MITPTQGRIVVYHPRPSDRVQKMVGTDAAAAHETTVTHTAIVAHVMSPQLVNLACFDSHGNHYASQGVVFIHEDTDERPQYGGWCEWHPDGHHRFIAHESGRILAAPHTKVESGEANIAIGTDSLNDTTTGS